MVAFQAVDPGSTPGRRSFAKLIAIKKSAFERMHGVNHMKFSQWTTHVHLD